MVKKISLFVSVVIAIFALVFFGIPQIKVESSDNESYDSESLDYIYGYDNGWFDAMNNYRDNILPGLLADAYNNGLDDGYDDGYENGYDYGYDDGYEYGYNYGYDVGFNHGLDEVFNTNNLMPFAEIRERGTYGPSNEFFGFTISINKKVNSITLLNLFDYVLKPIDWMSSSGSMRQGFNVVYEDSQRFYSFTSQGINDFNDMIYIELDENKVVEHITLALALNNPAMPNTDYDNMLEHMNKNLGIYINNKILNDNAIAKFKEIIEYRFITSIEYQQLLDDEFDKGYEKGLIETDAIGFIALLTNVFVGLGQLLNIKLFYDITFGTILLVPLVFGIISFIVGGRKKND